MSRLINDDELKKSIHEKTLFSKWQKVLIDVVIDDQPTVDAVPVVHGRWIRDEFGSKCCSCGLYAYRDKFGQPWESPYCPNCGSRNRGEHNE